jgi:hypothetical protein
MTENTLLRAGEVPEPIAKALRRLIHRVRGIILIRGLAAVIATAIGCILLVMAIDAAFTLFSQTFRWVLTILALAATFGVAVWLLLIPLAHTISLAGIARAIEQRHPELQERLSSAVELLTSKDIPEIRGSERLIAALAEEASRDAVRVQPRMEIPLRKARPFMLAAGGTVLILAALWAVFPSVMPRLFTRAVAPFMNLPNISADMLAVDPGDAVLPEGRRMEVQVTVANDAVKRCSLRRRLPDGTEQAEYMTALPANAQGHPRFTMTLPPGSESFRYRVHAGDALSRYYDVTVVPPPMVNRIDAHYAYPEYTGRPAETREDIAGDIQALAGTDVTVTARLNKRVTKAALRINGREIKDQPVEMTPAEDGTTLCTFSVHLKPGLRGRWALAMEDEYEFTNTSAEHRIEALADAPPTVEVLEPLDNRLRLKPSDRLPIDYAMTDDFGLAQAEFLVATDSRKRTRVPIPLPKPDEKQGDKTPRSANDRGYLLLSRLPLKGVKEFTFRVRVADNRPKDLRGPGQDFSRTITVEIDRSAASYAMQRLEADKEALEEGLKKVIKELEETKKDSAPLKDEAPRTEELEKGVADRVERMREHLGEADAEVGDMMPRATAGTFPGMAPKLEDLGQEVSAAESQAGQVKLADSPTERGQAAESADRHVDQAKAMAEAMLEELQRMADAAGLAQALDDLANQQADLAQQRAGAEPDNAWQQAQENLAGEIGAFVQDLPAAQQAALDQGAQAAANLASQARELQAEQAGLADQSEQFAQLSEMDQALQNLAAEQEQLAQDAAGTPVAADQAGGMHQAAENIQAGALPQAVQQQRAAEEALNQVAQGGQQQGGEQAGGEQAGGEQAGGEQAGGEQAGGEQPGGEQAGGEQAGGEQAGGEQAGGEQAGGEQAGGEQAGGEQAGGEQAGGEQAGGEQQGGQQGAPTAAQQEQAAQMAARQADIRQRTEELLAQRNELAEALSDSQMARIQAEQAQLAREATQLAEDVAPAGGQPASTGEQAAHDAQAASDQLPGNLPAAAESATSAAGELAQLAQALGQQAGGEQAGGQQAGGEQAGGEQAGGEQASGEQAGGEQAGGEQAGGEQAGGEQAGGQQAGGQQAGGEQAGGQQAGGQASSADMAGMAEQAQGLADRQAALAAEMQAMAQQTPAAAMAAAQESLAARTGALQQAAQALGERSADMAPQTSQAAGQAAEALGSAMESQGQAQQALAGGTPEAAPGAQSSAAESLGQAADALSSMGQALAQAAQGMPTPSQGDAAMGQPLAAGHAQASDAAATQSAAQAAQAAQSLAQAAGQAAAMAQAMGAQPGQGRGRQPGQAQGLQAESEYGTGTRRASMTAAKLEALGIKLSDWARLPGELRNDILQAADEGAPEEYRALIRRYFQKVAKQGGLREEGP